MTALHFAPGSRLVSVGRDAVRFWKLGADRAETLDNETINRFHPASGGNKVWNLPAQPGCFGLRDGNGAVIAARDGFYDIDFGTGTVRKTMDAPFDSTELRFNDGRTDRQGRLLAGTLAVDYTKITTRSDGAHETVRYPSDASANANTMPDRIRISL